MTILVDEALLAMMWLVLSAGLVFVMQVGFTALESGLTRSKNNVNVAIKNISDAGVSILVFWLVGFGIMFGASWNGWIGHNLFALSTDNGLLLAFFLFQAMFAATATTILSGAVAERMRFAGFITVAIVTGALIYPVFGHWAWSGLGGEGGEGWLAFLGFVDFAGATVVHSVGGWIALAAVLVIGPRTGRFDAEGRPIPVTASNTPLAVVGVLLLWFGWFGFNGGSVLTMNETVPFVLVNTVLGGASGLAAAAILGRIQDGRVHATRPMNGALAGLVSVTAGAHALPVWGAVVAGAVGGVVMVLVDEWLLRHQIDDAVGAVPVHLGAGIWGTMAVALLADPARLGTGLGRGEQLVVQLLGVATAGLWAFGVGWVALIAIDRASRNITGGLRVHPEAERVGLNVVEHGERSDLLDLVDTIDQQTRSGDLGVRAKADSHTEVGQIAAFYNRLLDRLEIETGKSRAVIEAAMDAIIVADDQSTVQEWNPAAERFFGIRRRDAVGQPIGALLSRIARPPIAQGAKQRIDLLQAMMSGGRHEVEAYLHSGEQAPFEVSSAVANVGGKPYRTGIWRDLRLQREAERGRAEQVERQRNQAEQEREETFRGRLLRMAAHELRTPLTPIRLHLAVLGRRREGMDPDQARAIDAIDRNATRLGTLVDEILDVLRLGGDQVNIRPTEQGIRETLEPELQIYGETLESHGLEYALHIDDGESVARFDISRLLQVILNLINNATKFTPKGGRVETYISVDGGDMLVRVSDTGRGLTEEERASLFTPFVQVHDVNEVTERGMGLGLFISKRLVELHGGRIWCESEGLGKGSTFAFRVPLAGPAADAAEAVAP